MSKKLLRLIFCIVFISNPLFAKNQYFDEGINLFNNKELLTTETELKAIASAAYTGFNKIPKVGYSTPAAIGIPKQL